MTGRHLLSVAGWRLFVAFFAVLLFAVAYSRAARRGTLGDEFQYIPRESVLVAATGDIESLWKGLESHLQNALRTSVEGQGLLGELKKEVRESKVDLPGLADLGAWGIDVHRGILVSGYRVTTAYDQFLVVLPISDGKRLLKIANEKLGLRPNKLFHWRYPRGRTYDVYGFDDEFFVAVPEPGICVVSRSLDLMRRSLLLRRENLAFANSNDGLYQAVKRRLRGPLLAGPNVFVYWQSRTAPFSERTGVIRVEPKELRVEADVELSGASVRIFDALRTSNPDPFDWARKLPTDTLAAVMAEDRQLDLYKHFLAEQVLHEDLSIPDVTRLLFAVTDFEDGLPDVLVGLWGNRDQLEKVASDLQRRLRGDRDLKLLNGALRGYRDRGGPPPSIADLERLRLLEPESDSLFHRYPILKGEVGNPEFQGSDFTTRSYERRLNGQPIFFLAPPFTANDLRYRQDLKAMGPRDLKSDRYRVACLFLPDSLWIATDVKDLERLTLPEAKAGPGLESNASYQVASRGWHKGAKVQAFADLDRLVSLGLLNPGSDLESLVRDQFFGINNYTTFGLEAAPSSDSQRLVVRTSLQSR